MTSEKRNLAVIGILYLLAMLSSMAGFYIISPLITGPEYLQGIIQNKNSLSFGVLFQLVNNAAVITIGILFFVVLKKYSEKIAITILSTRLLEGFLLTFGSMSLLTLIVVSKDYSTAVVDTSYLHLLGSLVKRYSSLSFDVAMLSLGSGGFILGYFLFQSRAVPRWIAVLGIIGSMLLFGRSLAVLMGYPQGFSLFLPITLFEFIFPVWLIIKGFNQKPADIQSSPI